MKKWGSWQMFMISIGLLCIMLSPQTTYPFVMIIGGLCIVLMGVIVLKKSARKERRKQGKL